MNLPFKKILCNYYIKLFANMTFFLTGEEVKEKWRGLKDSYVKQKNLYEKQCVSGSGYLREPKWKWWPFLRFLDGKDTVIE